MSQKNESVVLVLALLITAALLGGGYWWFSRTANSDISNTTKDSNNNNQNSSPTNQTPNPPRQSAQTTFAPPENVPPGNIRIEGSTSMVQINQALKNGFEKQFPGTTVTATARGTDTGIQALLQGTVELAAVSRPLTSQEKAQNLVAVPITQDAVAIVVGEKNPFRKGLTSAQVVGIFQGQITDWSKVGGTPGTIRVINRPPDSGTHQAFKELVLKGGTFGTTPNITTLQQDATTPLLQKLQTNGTGYATFAQVANQRTVRTVAVDGLTPEAANYPYQRTLYYVYKQKDVHLPPESPQVQAFLGYATSPQGKQALSGAN